MAYIVYNMPKINQTKIAIQIFKLVNINGDGKLQKNELKKVLLYFVSEEYLINFDKIFSLLDSENRGYIEYSEFLRATLDRKSIVTEENLKRPLFSPSTEETFYKYNLLYGNNTTNIIRTYSPKMKPQSSSVSGFNKKMMQDMVENICPIITENVVSQLNS